MGWTSTGDPYANVGEAGFSFKSEEDAKVFAEKHGWEYAVCVAQFLPSYLTEFYWGTSNKCHSNSKQLACFFAI